MTRLGKVWSTRTSSSRDRAELPLACVIGDVSMVRALGRSRIPVALVTSEERPNASFSRFCTQVVRTPSFEDEPREAVRALVAFARTQPTPPVVFYQGDHDLLALSRDRELLGDDVRIVLPPASLVESLVDKLRFAELAERCALPVPHTRILERGRSLEAELRGWNAFPCVLKPAMRTHWVGSKVEQEGSGTAQKAIRIEDRASLDRLLPLLAMHETDFVIQAAIEGGEERIHSYHAYVRPSGEIVCEFTGRKLRTYPRRYGYSTYVEVTDEHDVRELGRAVVARLGFSGVLKIDFKRDVRDERLSMLEINPRSSLWLHLGTLAGACIPELVYRDCLAPGSARPPNRVRTGVRWIVPREDVRGFREHESEGELTAGRWLFETFSADINEDLTIHDPLPGLVTLGEIARRRFARLIGHDDAPAHVPYAVAK